VDAAAAAMDLVSVRRGSGSAAGAQMGFAGLVTGFLFLLFF